MIYSLETDAKIQISGNLWTPLPAQRQHYYQVFVPTCRRFLNGFLHMTRSSFGRSILQDCKTRLFFLYLQLLRKCGCSLNSYILYVFSTPWWNAQVQQRLSKKTLQGAKMGLFSVSLNCSFKFSFLFPSHIHHLSVFALVQFFVIQHNLLLWQLFCFHSGIPSFICRCCWFVWCSCLILPRVLSLVFLSRLGRHFFASQCRLVTSAKWSFQWVSSGTVSSLINQLATSSMLTVRSGYLSDDMPPFFFLFFLQRSRL